MINRLLEKTMVGGPSECWLWTGLKSSKGYGLVRIDGVRKRAHRLSYEIYHGPIPIGLFVCHHCDNQSCVNPQHLFLGTARDNSDDKVAKGRQSRVCGGSMDGEKNGSAKLSVDDILAIRSALGVKQKVLAREYGVSQGHISRIVLGKQWKV